MQLLRLVPVLLIPIEVLVWLLLLFSYPLVAAVLLLAGLSIISLAVIRYTRRLERITVPLQPAEGGSRWISLRLIGPDLLGIFIATAILILLAVFLSLFIPHAGLH
jgi:hypothetical protein